MASPSRSCPSCGARVPQNAERCDLCGYEMPANPDTAPDDPDSPTSSNAAGKQASTSANASSSAESSSGRDSDRRSDPGGDDGSVSGSKESASSSVFCTECGSENPSSANFCSQCGMELHDSSGSASSGTHGRTRKVAADLPKGQPTSEAPHDRESTDSEGTGEEEERQMMSQQLMLTVGTAIIVLIALFFVTLWSQNQSWSSEASTNGDPSTQSAGESGGSAAGPGSGAAAGPSAAQFGGQDIATLIAENGTEMSSSVAAQADSIEGQLPNVEGDVKRTLQEQLVNLYVGASAFGRAARLQEKMAETSQDPDDWRRTGDLFYNWMEKVGAESNGKNPAIAPIGRRAIAAYEEVLKENPSDHDVRTDMATVLLRSNDPMRGVEELNRVLEEDSTFVPARFNKGIALLWIGRYQQAIDQFEAVQELTGEDSGQYQQAGEAIKLVREEMNANESPASSSEPPIAPTG